MIDTFRRLLVRGFLLVVPLCSAAGVGAEEFIGPLAGWMNAKTDFGAVGDGAADDTAALQKALDQIGNPGKFPVLYLPAGTYRITNTLTVKGRLGLSLLGEDPATTTMKWAGATGQAMIWFNGVSYSRTGRLTWDGSGTASVAQDWGWVGKEPNAGTHIEHADEVFKDTEFGLRIGSRGFMDAETAILRCQFLRCSKAGISIENFNALDIFVWHCLFDSCATGVTNKFGAGHYHVYENVFRNSTAADLFIGNTSYFGIRRNYSSGSKTFLDAAGGMGAPCLVTVQDNTVIHPQQTVAVAMGKRGPMQVIDNTFVTKPGTEKGPVVVLQSSLEADLTSIGNTFTVAQPVKAVGRLLTFDDKIVLADSLSLSPPTLPGTLPNLHRPIIEIPAGANTAAIQQAIDQAAPQTGKRPVVHFRAGAYNIDRTLVVPAGSDVQLVGDGYIYTSQLRWIGKDAGPVVFLPGPCRATLRDLHINGGKVAEGLVLGPCDQPGARVFMEQASIEGGNRTGLLVDRLDNTDVSLHDFYHSGNGESVKVLGGPRQAAGKAAKGRVAIFGGGSAGNELSYIVQNNGRLLAWDMWYETGANPCFFNLTGSGTLTLNGGNEAVAVTEGVAPLKIDNFSGKVTLMGLEFTTTRKDSNKLTVTGDGKNTRVLVIGNSCRDKGEILINNSPNAKVAFLNNRRMTGDNIGSVPIANSGPNSPDFVREMLAQLRTEKPRPLTDLPTTVTDARFFRVFVSDTLVGVHLKAEK